MVLYSLTPLQSKGGIGQQGTFGSSNSFLGGIYSFYDPANAQNIGSDYSYIGGKEQGGYTTLSNDPTGYDTNGVLTASCYYESTVSRTVSFQASTVCHNTVSDGTTTKLWIRIDLINNSSSPQIVASSPEYSVNASGVGDYTVSTDVWTVNVPAGWGVYVGLKYSGDLGQLKPVKNANNWFKGCWV